MTIKRTSVAVFVTLLAIGGAVSIMHIARSHSVAAAGTLQPEGGFDSPRLAALAKELAAGNTNALDRFYDELRGKAPLVEPVPDLPNMAWITFIWRADANARTVSVQGGPATGDYAAKMVRLGETDLWYRTDLVPTDSRFAYFFQVNRPVRFPKHSEKLPPFAPPQADPFNPNMLEGPTRSLAQLPDAPPQPWMQPLTGAANGSITQHKLKSKLLAGAWPGVQLQRTFAVYTPPTYKPDSPENAVMVLFDGGNPANPDLPLPTILDRLITERKIAPLVVIFVHQSPDRDREVGCSPHFADFVAKELIPLVRKHYRITADPKRTIAAGMSGGGLMAGYCGFRHSATFGNVLALSGAFGFWPGSLEEKMDEEPGSLIREFVRAERLPVRFYLAAGRFENWFFPYSMLGENRHFRDVLRAKGYSVNYGEFSGGHDPICWRGPMVEGLTTLVEKPK